MDDGHQLPCLPADLFLIVITRFLDPIDIVRCRRVSKQWLAAFTKPEFLKKALVWHHGDAREVAQLKETGELDASSSGADGVHTAARWMHVFDKVAARYHSLRTGQPQSIIEIQPFQHRRSEVIIPVDSRGYSLNWNHDLRWTYDSGLLVYADPESESYVVLDIAQNVKSIVPFDWTKSIVRKIRLKCNVLIIEWIGAAFWVEWDSLQRVHEYFVTAYDIRKFPYSDGCAVTLRSEWRLDPAGLPVDQYDRHISTHTSTHYAVYILRLPSRNRRVDNKPIESLLVWDIQQPSTCRPSNYTSHNIYPNVGPTLIKNLDPVSLDFYDVSQRKMLLFRSLELDQDTSGMLYFTEDSNMFLDISGDFPRADVPLYYRERVVGIPISGAGPRWECEKTIWSRSTGQGSLHPTRARSATCWREKWLPQNIRMKEFGEEGARLKFTLVHSGKTPTDCKIWISGQDWSGEVWKSRLDDSVGIQTRDVIIYGEERWIVGQRGSCIEILCFDKGHGRTRWRAEPIDEALAGSRTDQVHRVRYKKLFMYPPWN